MGMNVKSLTHCRHLINGGFHICHYHCREDDSKLSLKSKSRVNKIGKDDLSRRDSIRKGMIY